MRNLERANCVKCQYQAWWKFLYPPKNNHWIVASKQSTCCYFITGRITARPAASKSRVLLAWFFVLSSPLFSSLTKRTTEWEKERERGRKKNERERENFLFSAAGQARLAPPNWFRDSSPRSRCSPFSLWPSSRVRLLTHAAVTLCSPFDLLSVFRPFRSTPNENKSNQWKGKWNQLDCPLKLFQG